MPVLIKSARTLMAIALTALLGACVTPGNGQDAAGNGASDGQAINLAGSIEKHQLAISYSVSRVRVGYDDLIRVTLLLRNLDSKPRHIRPHVALTDAEGSSVHPFTRHELARLVAGTPGGAPSGLADMQWLKPDSRIPPQGIEIGELVYQATDLKYPAKLVVIEEKDRFEFTVQRP